jgi:hypothetical protein
MWLRAAFAGYICARARAARACVCLRVYAAGLCARKHFSFARVEVQDVSALSIARCALPLWRQRWTFLCMWMVIWSGVDAPASVYIDERRWKVCTHTHTHKRSLISCARCGRCIMRLLASSEQCVYVKRRTWWIRSREASACRNHSETQNRKPYLLVCRRHERRRPAETGQN